MLSEFRYRRPGGRIGDIVVDLGFCAREVVEECVERAISSGEQLGRVMVARRRDHPRPARGRDRQALRRRAPQPRRDPGRLRRGGAAADRRRAAPGRRADRLLDEGDGLLLAVANPDNFLALDDVSMFTNRRITPVVVSRDRPRSADAAHQRARRESIEDDGDDEEIVVRESADDAPTIRLVRSIIAQAVDRGASDVHFDPRRRLARRPLPHRRRDGRRGARASRPGRRP